jgi:hypothetical protein
MITAGTAGAVGPIRAKPTDRQETERDLEMEAGQRWIGQHGGFMAINGAAGVCVELSLQVNVTVPVTATKHRSVS